MLNVNKKYHYLRLAVEDSPSTDMTSPIELSLAFINEAKAKGESVLVHCDRGASRSATIVLAYLMQYSDKSVNFIHKSMTTEACIKWLQRIRGVVNPNKGFVEQLATRWNMTDIKNQEEIEDRCMKQFQK